MSYDKVTEPAGALEGLNLGAPIGAGSTSSFPAHPASSYTTGGNTGSQGLTGSNNHSHRDNEGESHRTAVGAAASNATDKYDTNSTGKYDTSARNTTSGDKGIGGGHGGPTAFESDASRVGTDRTGDHHHHHSSNSGLTGDRTGDRTGLKSEAKAALTPGHHDSSSRHEIDEHFEKGQVHQSHLHPGRNLEVASGATGAPKGIGALAATGVPTGHHHHDTSSRDERYEQGSSHRDGRYEQSNVSSGLPNVGSGLGQHEGHHHHHESSSHTGRNLAAGAGATGVATAVFADVGARDHTSGYEGIVNDSITGQTHFAPAQSSNTTGVSTGTRSTGLATGAGVGAGVGAGAGAEHPKKESLKEKLTGGNKHDNDDGPLSELKQELKDHQKSDSGYDTADKHPESKGPHGLVWHNGKYVHQRELDGHGSTGVPLK